MKFARQLRFSLAALGIVAAIGVHYGFGQELATPTPGDAAPADHGWDRPLIVHEEPHWFETYRRERGDFVSKESLLKATKKLRPAHPFHPKSLRLPSDGSAPPAWRG